MKFTDLPPEKQDLFKASRSRELNQPGFSRELVKRKRKILKGEGLNDTNGDRKDDNEARTTNESSERERLVREEAERKITEAAEQAKLEQEKREENEKKAKQEKAFSALANI
jgi:hypothetical protein